MRFSTQRYKHHLYVIPLDALGEVRAGRMDQRLFDVAGLVELGYADSKRSETPLIVQGNVPGDCARIDAEKGSARDRWAVDEGSQRG